MDYGLSGSLLEDFLSFIVYFNMFFMSSENEISSCYTCHHTIF